MNDIDLNQKLLNIMEGITFSSYGVPENLPEVEPEVQGSVTFKQEKNTDKGSVSIEAQADDMQELAKVLQLAGLTFPKGMTGEVEPEVEADPEVFHQDEPEEEVPCGSDQEQDQDVSYSVDKQEILNNLRSKLQKSLS